MKKVLLSLMAASLVLTACEDEFTEKDLLEAQQSVSYSVRLVDATQNVFSDIYAVAGVTVTLTQGGSVFTATTNADGYALFPQVKLGELNYRITSDKYYSVEGSDDLSDARPGQSLLGSVAILPKAGENVATITGQVDIDKDRTSPGLELVTSGTIEFSNWNSEPIIATIDGEGKYTVSLPASKDGIDYSIGAPLITLDQIQDWDVNDDGIVDENDKKATTFILAGPSWNLRIESRIGQALTKNLQYTEY